MTRPTPDEPPKDASPDDLFEVARKAAKEGQPDRMIEALAVSGFLDGLVRQLGAKWSGLPNSEVEDCIALAVDGAYDAIRSDRRVSNLGAWLWKTADNHATDRWRKDYSQRTQSAGGFQDLRAHERLSDEERGHQDALADHRRGEAIRLARQLLPRIGEGQVIGVMGLVIDAVEQGVPDLSPADIGDALGITQDAARTLLGRGFTRLRREACKEGIELPEDLPGPGDALETAEPTDGNHEG